MEWTIIFGKNWQRAQFKGTRLTLSGPYDLNDKRHSGGTNMYLLNMKLTQTVPGTDKWTLLLAWRGSNGIHWENAREVSGESGFRLARSDERTLSSSGQFELTRIGGEIVSVATE